MEHDLELVPVINKIDLPSAQPDLVKKEIEDVLGLEAENAPLISAKNGIGTKDVLESIVKLIPPPKGHEDAPLRALVFDSYYDSYRGAIAYVRVMEGRLKVGDKIRMMASGKEFEVNDVGFSTQSYLLRCPAVR
jgi:GTP-binding protein LepA